MPFDAQSLTVLAVVAGAAGYLARVVWKVCSRPAGGCGTCGDCPSGKANHEPNVVAIGSATAKDHS